MPNLMLAFLVQLRFQIGPLGLHFEFRAIHYTRPDAVSGRQRRLVLERYGVTVVKLCRTKVVLNIFG
jgi:hypothetical protein